MPSVLTSYQYLTFGPDEQQQRDVQGPRDQGECLMCESHNTNSTPNAINAREFHWVGASDKPSISNVFQVDAAAPAQRFVGFGCLL